MAEEANWPIRVGTDYAEANQDKFQMHYRVTAIDGDRIHYTAFFANPQYGGPSKMLHSSAVSARVFRTLASPEGQSPIPILVRALLSAREYIRVHQPQWAVSGEDQPPAMNLISEALQRATEAGYETEQAVGASS